MTLPIPQTDPKANCLAHKDAIDAAIARVLDSGWYILGREVATFESEFANYTGAKFAVGVASGTDALFLALRACGVKPGDLVLTVSHTAVATVAAIEQCGATPAFVDVHPSTLTMDPSLLEDSLRSLPSSIAKAVIPVHIFGHPADMDSILQVAAHYDLRVIEDCAQSHGAAIGGKKTGTFGDAAAFSFYPTKNLGAIGDGGMVVTDDPRIQERVRTLREYGWTKRYVSDHPGHNSRLDELQAAILRAKLPHLDRENESRRKIAYEYREQLRDTSIMLPNEIPGYRHVYHQYAIRTPQRDTLRENLSREGIRTLIHYPVPVHLQPAYAKRIRLVHPLPQTELFSREGLSLPMFPELSEEQVTRVTRAIREWNK